MGDLKTPRFHSEINWPLGPRCTLHLYSVSELWSWWHWDAFLGVVCKFLLVDKALMSFFLTALTLYRLCFQLRCSIFENWLGNGIFFFWNAKKYIRNFHHNLCYITVLVKYFQKMQIVNKHLVEQKKHYFCPQLCPFAALSLLFLHGTTWQLIWKKYICSYIFFKYYFSSLPKGQLNSESIYEVIVSLKCQPKDFCLTL